MNQDLFNNWADQANVPGGLRPALIEVLSKGQPETVDAILRLAVSRNWTIETFVEKVGKMGMDCSSVPGYRAASANVAPKTSAASSQPSVSPILAPAPRNPAPSTKPATAKAPKGDALKKVKEALGKMFSKKSKSAGATYKSVGKKPKTKPLYLYIGVGVVVLALLAVAGLAYYRSSQAAVREDGFSAVPSVSEVPSQVVVDPALVELSPEEKEAQANQLLEQQTAESTVKKPTSWNEVWENFPWGYIFYFLGVPALLLMTYRDRTQAREFSDVILAVIGVAIMTVAVLASSFWPVGLDQGWTTGNVLLVLGFAIHMALQFGAFITGQKDYTVLAMGPFVTGLLLRWWYINNPLLNSVGLLLMVIGMIVQILEIRRNGKVGRSITGAILAVLIFVLGYAIFFYLIQGQLSLMAIQGLDEASLYIFWTKGQEVLSILGGLVFSLLFGVIYGFLVLPTKGRDTGFDVQNLKVLDADSQALGIMILYALFPEIGVLKALIVALLA